MISHCWQRRGEVVVIALRGRVETHYTRPSFSPGIGTHARIPGIDTRFRGVPEER